MWVMEATRMYMGWDHDKARKLVDSSFYAWSPHPTSPGDAQVIITNTCRPAGNRRNWGLAWTRGRDVAGLQNYT